ncbi:MAG: SpoIIE family protein phosphatase [Leptospiraceae bacterium]|nr:SpoIIE family protein phosphatase [Leptospiraceae bacterium]
MSQETLITLLHKNKGGTASIKENENLTQVFVLILNEAIKNVGAKAGFLFFLDEKSELKSFGAVSANNQSKLLADYSFRERKNLRIKKDSIIPGSNTKADQSYISCYLGDDSTSIGIFLLEGINHFENFSTNDFELISVYSKTLSQLLKDSLVLPEKGEIFLHFTTAIQLLLNSTNNLQKNTRLEFLLKEVIRVSGLINSSRHLTNLLKDVMESVKSVFRTESCSILLVDKTKNELYFHIVAGEKEEELQKIRVPMGKGIAGTVAVTRVPMIINDAQNDDRVYKVVDKASDFTTRNILAAPLIADDEVIGVMEGINTIDRNNFNDSDIELFLSFSDAAAVAIQKTRLLDNLEKTNRELEKKVSELGSLFDLGKAVLESKDEADLIRKSIRIVVRELDAKRAAILIIDSNKQILNLWSFIDGVEDKSQENFIRDSIIVLAMIENKILLKDAFINQPDSDILDKKFLKDSFILLPLLGNNQKPFGAICISERIDNSYFKENDLRLLQTISSQFIKGYENIKLNADMIAKKAMQKEIEITRNIQNNILPSKIPSGSNFQLGVKSVPAKDVSGDFYDFYKYEDGQFSFLIADVSGKSLPAAIFMAMSSSVMRTLSRNHEMNPADLLKAANSLIYEDSQSGMFVTLFFIHYNPSNMEIEFASAGHNDQIWIKADETYEFIKGTGAPLGVIPTGKYVGGKIQPKSGDMVVLYTDGAIEEKDKDDNEFGLERFVQEIIKRKNKNPQEIIEEVYKEIVDYSESTEQFDDFTVLILKFNDDFQFRKTFPAINAAIPKFRDFLFDTIKIRNLSEYLSDDILLCCDEAATNVVMHSYKDTNLPNPTFECAIKFTEDTIIILIQDKGIPFDRNKVPEPSLEANLKGERRGGFGVFLVEKLMDKVTYSHENGINTVTIEKKIVN